MKVSKGQKPISIQQTFVDPLQSVVSPPEISFIQVIDKNHQSMACKSPMKDM